MKKIEFNNKIIKIDEEYSYKWELTGNGEKCLKLTLLVYEDGELDEKLDYFLKHEDVRAKSETAVIFPNAAIKNIYLSSDVTKNIKADKEGGFSSSQEVIEYETKIAKENL